MVKISKDMLINDILAVDAGNAAILMAAGMHCIGCLAAAGESLEEAAAVHGLDAEELEQEINDYLASPSHTASWIPEHRQIYHRSRSLSHPD